MLRRRLRDPYALSHRRECLLKPSRICLARKLPHGFFDRCADALFGPRQLPAH